MVGSHAGRRGGRDPGGRRRGDQESSGTADDFSLEGTFWIDRLPRDGRLRLTVAWPEAGLAENTTVLALDDLDGLGDRVVALL